MKKKIRTLKELQLEQEKLKIKIEVTEHAFLQSLQDSQQLTKQYLWSKVKLPALVVGTAIKGAQQLFSSDEDQVFTSSSDAHWLQRAIPLALSVAEMAFSNKEHA